MKNLSKIVSSLVIVGTILSVGAVAMAAETRTSSQTNSQITQQAGGKMMKGGHKDKGTLGKGVVAENIEDNLKTLVSSGIITQDEADKILALSKHEAETRQAEMDKVKNMTEDERKAYFETNKKETRDKKGDIFTVAVSNGIITQEKADNAKAKLNEARSAENQAKVTEALNGLVIAQTITQEQADKILTYINTIESNRSQADRTAETMQNKEKKSHLSAFVDDGTLTQAQLDEVCKVLPVWGGRGHGGNKDFGGNKTARADKGNTSSSASN
jgi:hypothetical protein